MGNAVSDGDESDQSDGDRSDETHPVDSFCLHELGS